MIQIQDIKKEFDGKEVLSGVYEEIQRGEIFAIIGPSGQGKTTLLRILNLLETPSSGTVLFDNTQLLSGKVCLKILLLVFGTEGFQKMRSLQKLRRNLMR